MDKKSLCELNKIELHTYEMLGVKLFRRAILLFERIKHHKDGGQNENYHIKGRSIVSLRSFSGYLLYNTMLHIVSILMTIFYFAIARSSHLNYLGIDIFVSAIVVFNLYCIMLQRYNYLKIKAFISKIDAKRDKRIQAVLNRLSPFLAEKDNDELCGEYALIQKFFNSMVTGAECILDADCAETLNRLAAVAEYAEVISPRKARTNLNDISLCQSLSDAARQTHLIGRTERRVSALQKCLKRPVTSNVLFGYSIITEDSKCEEAFCRLFPAKSCEKMEFTITVLLAAYQQKGLVM